MDQERPSQELQVGGAVPLETGVYVVRRSDQELLEALRAGEYCNVPCARQMGKTSAILRIRADLRASGFSTAFIDVAGRLGTPANSDDWYIGLLVDISKQFKMDRDIKSWWLTHPAPTPNQRLLAYFRDEVLAQHLGIRFAVFLDEIDHTLKLPYTDDFFLAIRSLYNERAGESDLRRITFCLVGAFIPTELVKQRGTTTYNVGRTIELKDFNPLHDDLTPLASTLSQDPVKGKVLLLAVLRWTGGQPHLTALACNTVTAAGAKSTDDVDVLITAAVAIAADQLLDVRLEEHYDAVAKIFVDRARKCPEAISLYRQILIGTSERPSRTPAVGILKICGLIRATPTGQLVVRNEIYRRRFDEEWVKQTSQSLDMTAPFCRDPEVFVSYAWGDSSEAGKLRQEVVDELCRALATRRVQLHRDSTDLLPGERISSFMGRLSAADLIIVVISKKYLHSYWCMYELFKIYRNCGDAPDRFLDRIIPILLPDAELASLHDRLKYVAFWQEQLQQLEEALNRIKRENIGQQAVQKYRTISEFARNVSDMLEYVTDKLSPREIDTLRKNQFQEIVEQIETEATHRRSPDQTG